jgi:hypothetical protein
MHLLTLLLPQMMLALVLLVLVIVVLIPPSELEPEPNPEQRHIETQLARRAPEPRRFLSLLRGG